MKKLGLLTIIFLALVSAAFAQTGLIRGKVVLTNQNTRTGTITGAKVELYRTDIWTKLTTTYSDNSGEFVFAGLSIGGTYVVAVSGQGLAANGALDVKAGNENLVINVKPGNGEAYSEQRLKEIVEFTQKRKQEEDDFKAANQLVAEKKYAAAVAQYDAVLKKYPASRRQNEMFRGKALALLNLGLDAYNGAIESKNDNERLQGFAKAKEYASQATAAAEISVMFYDTESKAPSHTPTNDFNEKRKQAGSTLLDAIRLYTIFTKQVDLLPKMKTALDGYLRFDLTAAQRGQALKAYGETLVAMGVWDQALPQFAQYLKEFPNDFEAYSQYATCLLVQAESQESAAVKTEMLQMSADYYQKFLDAAPVNHKLTSATTDGLKYLKDDYKITPRVSATKQPPIKPTSALGMWTITLKFTEGTQTYALFLEKNGAVSGGKMFVIQGSNFDIRNFRQIGKTVSFTAMFGKVPVAFSGTIDAALTNMKGSLTGMEKGKRITATWDATRDTKAEAEMTKEKR